jgi:hypothetical protein
VNNVISAARCRWQKAAVEVRKARRVRAMNKRDDWREWESGACDESQASTLGWETESQRRDDNAASDARPSAQQRRIMVIGFSVIRV